MASLYNSDKRNRFRAGYIDVSDKWMLVTVFGCWFENFEIGDAFQMSVPDTYDER